MTLILRPNLFSTEADRLFNALFDGESAGPNARWTPAMDLVEAGDHFVVRADLPGLDESDVAIEVQDNTLVISGERRADQAGSQNGWYRVERSFGRFSRSLTLPEGVDPEGVGATFDRGVLEVRIPKPQQRQPRRIEIRSGDGASTPTLEGTASDSPAATAPAGNGASTDR